MAKGKVESRVGFEMVGDETRVGFGHVIAVFPNQTPKQFEAGMLLRSPINLEMCRMPYCTDMDLFMADGSWAIHRKAMKCSRLTFC